MVVGLSLSAFTTLHVILSLVALLAGIVVMIGMLASLRLGFWAGLFLATAILTSATGYLFRAPGLLPSHIVGAISLIVLLIAALAFYGGRLRGARRWLYVICVTLAVYLDAFVGVVQAFQKLAFFHALAPTQSEAPFAIAQLVVLAIFLLWGFFALRWFAPERTAARFATANW
ncbi:MAG TPA: hypothetical protein VHY80_11675 [Stellaceae bacterium]|jgi:hypothetical protein|nr:hypothetical protein [Stellaceae bacterium]